MITRHAACRCGQLKAVAAGEPIRISMCHCFACQLRTGSVFGVQARFTRDSVRVDGRSSQYVRTADSGNRVIYHFCPDCGSTVHYSLEQFPDVIAIPVGAFADSSFPSPRYSVYESRRHAWAGAPPDVEHFE